VPHIPSPREPEQDAVIAAYFADGKPTTAFERWRRRYNRKVDHWRYSRRDQANALAEQRLQAALGRT